jgi:hypothetical protein
MASTHSPSFNWLESPHGTTGRPLTSIFNSAISVFASVPITLARTSRLSGSATVTSVDARTRSPTTWLLVTT